MLAPDNPDDLARRAPAPPPVDDMGNQTGIQGAPNLTGSLTAGAELHGHRLVLDDGELPDDNERKVTPDVPAEEKNSAGSYEALLRMAGGMGGAGSS